MATYYKHFGKSAYWEEQYKKDKTKFEWIQDYQGIRDVITQYIPKEGAIILNVGCGVSKIPEYLYNEGFKFIISVDRSKECVQHMRTLYPKMPKTFQFLQMDCLDMDFDDKNFTVVFDKGLIDSISSGFRSTENVKTYIQEIWRVLQNQGIYICISHQKDLIEDFLAEADVEWENIEVNKIYKPTYERESELIRQHYVSKEVLDKIEDLSRVRIVYDPEDEAQLDPHVVPYEDMEEFVPSQREPPVLLPEGNTQPDVSSHYIYVCTKNYQEPVIEPQEEKSQSDS